MSIITEDIATRLEAYFKKNIKSITKATGLDLHAVSIGGKFNRDGILIELGFMPKGVSPESVTSFIIENQNAGHDVSPLKPEPYTALAQLTGLERKLIKKLRTGAIDTGLRARTCDMYKLNATKYVCVGYSNKQEVFVFADADSGQCKYIKAERLAKFKRLKEKFDLN